VERLLLIDAVVAVALSAFWYFCFAVYNRRRAIDALRWVETACSRDGRIVQARWISPSRLQAQVNFASHWFDKARVTVHLFPRPLPFKWLYCICRKQNFAIAGSPATKLRLTKIPANGRWFGPVR
jgi:hypothetical protein